MPQTGIVLYLKPLRSINPLLSRRLFHKFYFQLEQRFEKVSLQVSKLDPWLNFNAIQNLLSTLLVKANRFILIIDEWLEEGLLDAWMGKDANRLWEKIVRYVYKKRGLKFKTAGDEYYQQQ